MSNDLLHKRAAQYAYAKDLLREVVAASEAAADVREQFMTGALDRVRRALGENGRLA